MNPSLLRAFTGVVCAAAVEVAAIITTLALYPSGISGGGGATDVRTCPPSDAAASVRPFREQTVVDDSPVLLVHGLSSNQGIFYVLRRKLQRAGFPHVTTLNYSWLTTDVRSAAQMLATEVERLCERGGHERVHVIGHSLGGLVARYYVQRMGGDARVHTLVTLGTPHHGTLTAMVPIPHPVIRQLRPGSDVLAELAEPASGCATRFIAFHSDLDQLIIPTGNARLAHPDLRTSNIPVRAVGHASLPLHPRVVSEVCRVLHDTQLPQVSAAA
ncbi:esterase/lipase family protein [Streptomyces sp. NBC_01538]|uniref:esterase/lipase family protein n=1 Tax=Streptomyces sp. NBC_01538 TaxID=2903897 RepID=UPI003870C3CC